MGNVLGELFCDIADAIREKTGDTATMKPIDFSDRIRGIEGASPELKWVTFMSHDGLTEYGKKPVAVGDDCADPITRGLFDTPTRERDAQYSYTFAGWSTEAGGGLDSNALKTVNEDRTLYANFAAVLRYYTITYYDDDGTTVLATQGLAYGATPAYTPAKIGYTFTGWTPAVAAVTEAASYQATWIQKMDFDAMTWAQISEVCKAGNHAAAFDIGATKTFTFTNYSGTTMTAIAQIIGFDHDDLADGSGKAPITLRLSGFPGYTRYWHITGLSNRDYATWSQTEMYTGLHNAWTGDSGYEVPADLLAVAKTVSKKHYDLQNKQYVTSEDQIFLMSMSELGYELDSRDEGARYEAFDSGKAVSTTYEDLVCALPDGSSMKYWTRTRHSYGNVYYITAEGMGTYMKQGYSDGMYPLPCVCIG